MKPGVRICRLSCRRFDFRRGIVLSRGDRPVDTVVAIYAGGGDARNPAFHVGKQHFDGRDVGRAVKS